LLKILTAPLVSFGAFSVPTATVQYWRTNMKRRANAECERPLDDIAVRVNGSGELAEVCCAECALALTDAGAAALPEV
jgi:hypothetical protein